jgi:hypothetical protein
MNHLEAILAVSAIFGFLVGGFTVAGAFELYPPSKGDVWPKRARVPENLGVKTSVVPSVQWRG